jgi:hypothetical protein
MNEESYDPRMARALEVKGRQAQFLRGHPNVTGLGVGFREVRGKRTEEIVLRVFVSRKLPLSELAPEDVLPREIDGVQVDVAEERQRALSIPAEHQRRHSETRCGISIGNQLTGGSGTLGATVFDGKSGQQLILSNWHVLCGRLDCEPGEPILQPGTGGGDGGTPADLFARVLRFRFDEHVDAAVAVLTGHRFCSEEMLGLGHMTSRLGSPTLGLSVSKSGRTTGVTAGRITDGAAGRLGQRLGRQRPAPGGPDLRRQQFRHALHGHRDARRRRGARHPVRAGHHAAGPHGPRQPGVARPRGRGALSAPAAPVPDGRARCAWRGTPRAPAPCRRWASWAGRRRRCSRSPRPRACRA